jgi:hypothetical protein
VSVKVRVVNQKLLIGATVYPVDTEVDLEDAEAQYQIDQGAVVIATTDAPAEDPAVEESEGSQEPETATAPAAAAAERAVSRRR